MALTKISTGGVKDDAVSADKLAKPIDLADNEQIRLGTGNDLKLWHDGTNSRIAGSTGATMLYSTNDDVYIEGADDVFIQVQGGETALRAFGNAQVELYYDNSKKAETSADGWNVTGMISSTGNIQIPNDTSKLRLGASQDLDIYHNGTDSYINHTPTSGKLQIRTDEIRISSYDGDEAMIKSFKDGGTYLYYDGSNKLETTSSGVTVTGSVSDSKGDVRKIPKNAQSSAYTLVASDAGKIIVTNSNVTLNTTMGEGDVITILNESTSDITITQGSGVIIYNSADGSTGNRTLAARGMATLYSPYSNGTNAYISGTGLS
tara:strand:- start:450 stop:1406 length:957 start_codon:yes stop_codon:yes gene_type:complete